MDKMLQRLFRADPQAPPRCPRHSVGDSRPVSDPAWSVRIHVDQPRAGETVREAVREGLDLAGGGARKVIVVCIGTDRSTGDALGPLTGYRLLTGAAPGTAVFGTLEEPVHAGNLTERLLDIHRLHPASVVVAVDACLGSLENVGTICVGLGALRPGAGVNKALPPVGDLHVTGVVNVGGFMEYFVLQNTRLHLVMKMSAVIAQGLAGLAEQSSPGLGSVDMVASPAR